MNVTIDVDGRQYSADVVGQKSSSSGWISLINFGGCAQTVGTTLAFRLADSRAVLVSAYPCYEAQKELADPGSGYPLTFAGAMQLRRTVEFKGCYERTKNAATDPILPHGYLVDNADQPSRWEGFRFGEKLRSSDTVIRLMAATAQAMKARPRDDLDAVAPGVLRTSFQYKKSWSHSPEPLIAYDRRKSKGFIYQAVEY